MKSIITFLLVFLVINFANAQTKTQNARVKTRGRMIDGEYVPGKGLPGTVVSIKDITDIGVRNSDGTFTFPVDSNNYFVENVAKNEYVLVDSDAVPKMYNYSEDTLYFVMSMPEQMFEDLLEAKDKIRKSLEREWKNAMAEIKRLKEENMISQEEYLEKLKQLMSNQEKNEDLVNEMAKRYSSLDYDQLDAFYRKVNNFIEEGKLTKADSMLRSRGNVSAQIDAQHRKKESVRQDEEKIRKAKSVLKHDDEELERRCYSYFESFKMQHKYDSAAYYIEQRARIDTLNAKWQFEAGVYSSKQRKYNIAETYMQRSLRLYLDLIKSDDSFVDYVAKTLNDLAYIYRVTQRYSDAEQMYVESLGIRRKLSKDNPQVYEPDVAETLNDLALLYKDVQRYSDAEQMYVESLEISRKQSKDNPQAYELYVARVLNNLATLYIATQRYSDAEQMFVESLEIRRKLSKDNPQVYEPDVAMTLNNLATLYKDTQRYSDAEQMYVESLEIRRKLSKDNPQAYEPYVANTINNLAILYIFTQRYSDAEQMYVESLEIYRKLSKDNPQAYEPYVARVLNNLALLYKDVQRYSDAEQMFVESLEISRKQSKDNPQVYEPDVANTLNNLAILYSYTQRYSDAEQMFVELLEIRRKQSKDNPQVYEPDVAMSLCNLATLYKDTQRYSDAEQMYVESLEIYRKLSNDKPQAYEPYVASVLNNLATLYYKSQRYSDAEQMYVESLEIRRKLFKDNPQVYEPDVAISLCNLAILYYITQRYSDAEQMYVESLEIFGKLAKDNPLVYEPYVVILYHYLISLYDITNSYSKSYTTTEEILPKIKCMYDEKPEQNKEDYFIILQSHSLCCMFNKEFSKAEQYAREGLEVDSTQTSIYTKLASSLLLQGKYKEAEKIYKKYKSELKESFLSDFEQFEAEGIIPPEYKSDVEMIKELLNE